MGKHFSSSCSREGLHPGKANEVEYYLIPDKLRAAVEGVLPKSEVTGTDVSLSSFKRLHFGLLSFSRHRLPEALERQSR